MTTSKQQVSRLLAMVPYLQAHPGVGIEEVARIFGITAKQVLADLQVLWMCGTPGGLPDDLIEIDMDSVKSDGVIHLANADYLPRPLRFVRDEAMSLVVALQTIAETASGELAEAARSAADKLRAIGAEAPVLVAVRSGDPQVRDRLTTAINAGKAVRLTYDGAARSTTTHPVVDPGLVVLKDSVAYLHGWSHERRAWRIYRLDRIAEVEILSQQVTYESLPALGTGWFDEIPEEVLLHLAPEASWIPEYHPVREVRTYDDGSLTVRLAVADPGWLDALLLRLGDLVLAVTPSGARSRANELAREALGYYG
ncbi:YD repeat (two copies) [Propionibacterium sp. oral taxon 192 str. F0372]|uniref:helix-turn-helix transcriptional regulator n=1 Tax=Propionibacterium sp. oral taxon 192 TaxID=671222 RepID=UPI0003543868|nr:WYL domain-containing protein [Propionibacterium sp. oral taxon 192]EPH00448.1 YD repeat (two copies) [Propionibacterium sp. oral taxon 192 str. F0372]